VTKHKRYISAGKKATTPLMGVDYLQLGEQVGDGSVESYKIDHFHFRRTNLADTRQLIENYHVVAYWNHSCWYPDLMLQAYKKYRPDWYEALMRIKEVFDKPGENEAIEKIYATMEKGATEDITKHIMESGDAIALLLPFKVTDIGTWGAVYDFFEDGVHNYEDGNVISVETVGSLIKSSSKEKLIAVAGVRDVVVVDTSDALLVISKEQIDKIKDIQKILEERNETEYL
jgi:mannose-1-phosphate guanylyltransferase